MNYQEWIIIPTKIVDLILNENRSVDLIALYTFYQYTALWQKSNSIQSITTFTSKKAKLPTRRLHKAKNKLLELKLIENRIIYKDGRIERWEIYLPPIIDNIEPIIISKIDFDCFLKQSNCPEILALYTYYYYAARKQKTNQIIATTEYTAERLGITSERLRKAKKFLIKSGLIKDIRSFNKKKQKPIWLIKLKYKQSKNTYQELAVQKETGLSYLYSQNSTLVNFRRQLTELIKEILQNYILRSLYDKRLICSNTISVVNTKVLSSLNLLSYNDDQVPSRNLRKSSLCSQEKSNSKSESNPNLLIGKKREGEDILIKTETKGEDILTKTLQSRSPLIGTESKGALINQDFFISTTSRGEEIKLRRRIPLSDPKVSGGVLSDQPNGSVGAAPNERSPINRIGFAPLSPREEIQTQLEKNPNLLKPFVKIFSPKEPKMSPSVKKLVDLWENLGLRKSRRTTKTFKSSVDSLKALLDGTIFQNCSEIERKDKRFYTEIEIELSIRNFAKAALDKNYYPTSNYKHKLKSYSINTFVYNSFSPKMRSLFLKYLGEEPKIVPASTTEVYEDKHQHITANLIYYYRNKVMGGMKIALTIQDRNHFILAAEKLVQFYGEHKDGILTLGSKAWDDEMTDWLCESIAGRFGGENSTKFYSIQPSIFSSDITFTKTLPAYLLAQGLYYLPNEGIEYESV